MLLLGRSVYCVSIGIVLSLLVGVCLTTIRLGVSGQNAQINGSSAGPAAPLSAEFVSNTIKDAFGSFKSYLDSSIQKVKEDSEKKLEAASSDLQQLKRAQEVSFRSKGHRLQFEFNANLQDKLEKGVALYEEDKRGPALDKFKEAIAEVKKRNKLIRFADKSDAGWLVYINFRLLQVHVSLLVMTHQLI